MSLDHLLPFAGQHAIQSAAFAVDFATELDVGEVGELRRASAALFGDFPKTTDQQRHTFHVGNGPQGPHTAASDVGGFVMERPAPIAQSAAIRSLIVNRESITAVINDYTRWENFKTDVDRYLSPLMSRIDQTRPILTLGLQFTDVFIWRADPSDLKLREVFSANNKYMAENSLSDDVDLWHSHHGFITHHSAPTSFQQLDNINISRVIVNAQHQIQILTSHRATFPTPLYKAWSDNHHCLTVIREQMHAKNKNILSELLTKEMQLKINLGSPKG